MGRDDEFRFEDGNDDDNDTGDANDDDDDDAATGTLDWNIDSSVLDFSTCIPERLIMLSLQKK